MARKTLSLTLALAMLLTIARVSSGATQRASVGQVAGIAQTSDGRGWANQPVQLRDLATVEVISRTFTNELGEFDFSGIAMGAYVVELTEAERVVAASGTVVLTPQSPLMKGITLVVIAQGAEESRTFWTSAAGLIILAAIAAGAVAAVVVAAQDTVASPSQ